MSRETVRIRLTHSAHSRVHPVQVGSLRVDIPVGEPVDVPEPVLEVLDHAAVRYERLDTEPVTEESPGVLGLLDGPVSKLADGLPDVSDHGLRVLLEAEQNGKTRKSAVAAIEDEIASRQTQE